MSGVVSGTVDSIGRFIGRYPYQLVIGLAVLAIAVGFAGWGDGLAIFASASSLLLIWKHEDANPRPIVLEEGQTR